MRRKLFILIILILGIQISAKDICDSSWNYLLYESSRKCFSLGNNLAFASLGLIAVAGLSTLVSRDMPYFFLEISPIPLLASLPFYLTGGIRRSMYDSHLTKCGNFKRTDLSMSSGSAGDALLAEPFGQAPASPCEISYCISVGFDF